MNTRVIEIITINQKNICKDAMNIIAIYVDSAEVYDEFIRDTNIRPRFNGVMKELNNMSYGIRECEKIMNDPAVVGVVLSEQYGLKILEEIYQKKQRIKQEWEDFMNRDDDDNRDDRDDWDYAEEFQGWFGGATVDI